MIIVKSVLVFFQESTPCSYLFPIFRHFYKGREERYPAVMKTSEFTWANMILFSVVPCECVRLWVLAESC